MPFKSIPYIGDLAFYDLPHLKYVGKRPPLIPVVRKMSIRTELDNQIVKRPLNKYCNHLFNTPTDSVRGFKCLCCGITVMTFSRKLIGL